MSEIYEAFYESPIGWVGIVGSDQGIKSIGFVDTYSPKALSIPPCLTDCIEELDGYFKGNLRRFSVRMCPEGTDFQKKVWTQVSLIPFGRTLSYKGIAEQIGNPNAVRAVGNANGKNKIPIMIPCHRVVGTKGDLVGYGGGLWRKQWLLNHEQKVLRDWGNGDRGQ